MKTPKIGLGLVLVLVCFVSTSLAQEQEESTEPAAELLLNGKNETLVVEEELEESSENLTSNSNATARELRKVETGKLLIFQNPTDPKSTLLEIFFLPLQLSRKNSRHHLLFFTQD